MKLILTNRDYCLARLKHEKPSLPFPISQPKAHAAWRRKFSAALWREFGRLPEKVAPQPRVLERQDCGDYTREKILLRVERFMWMPLWVLTPKQSPLRSKNGKLPALLAAHGHENGQGGGKNNVIGETWGEPKREKLIRHYNYDYGRQAVRRGYVVIAPDWRGFGERRDPADWIRANRDGCNVANLAVEYFGMHLLGLNVWDGIRALDYLVSRPEVDARRIGCIGLSFGGTMTTYLTAFDSRIKAACISGYVSTLANAMGPRCGNFCGSQAMPGLACYGDIPEVALLAAPRPLCLEIGLQENCFEASDMLKAARYVTRGYRALGVADRLVINKFPGPHRFDGRKTWDFFEKWL
jgi:hypothetical protein